MKALFFSTLFFLVNLGLFAQCLVADYPFNDDATDNSGNGYDATVYGATLTTDRFGNPNAAYEFDGVNDYIHTYSTFDFQERTVSAWMMPYDVQSTLDVLVQDDAALQYGAFEIRFKNGNLHANGGGDPNLIYSSPTANTWYHVVLVRNAVETKVYLDGNLVYTGTASGNGSSSSPNDELVIGAGRSLNNYFHGKIDDIQIYDCELNAEEIDSLYKLNQYTGLANKQIKFTKSLKIYPNPVEEECRIEFDNPGQIPYTLTLMDGQGRVVRQIGHIRESYVTFTRKDLPTGLYFFQLKDGSHIYGGGTFVIQ